MALVGRTVAIDIEAVARAEEMASVGKLVIFPLTKAEEMTAVGKLVIFPFAKAEDKAVGIADILPLAKAEDKAVGMAVMLPFAKAEDNIPELIVLLFSARTAVIESNLAESAAIPADIEAISGESDVEEEELTAVAEIESELVAEADEVMIPEMLALARADESKAESIGAVAVAIIEEMLAS